MGVLEVKKLIGEGLMTPTRVLHVSGTCFCRKIAHDSRSDSRVSVKSVDMLKRVWICLARVWIC